MAELKYLSAFAAGHIVGRFMDPLGVAVFVVAALFGFSRLSRWAIPGVAAFGSAATFPAVWSWWEQTGFMDQWVLKSVWIFVTFTVVSAVGYAAGALLAKVARSRPV